MQRRAPRGDSRRSLYNIHMKDFIKYFTGLQRDYGFCNIEKGYKDPTTGKIRFNPGDYGWAGKSITEKEYELHLQGKKSIGIQPCDDNGFARFGAIDVDPKIYKDLDIKFYLDVIQKKELPLVPIKSKSGGLHLYVFTKEPVKSLQIKEFLEQVLFLFKLPLKTEIFPKQTKLGTNPNGDRINGNFINLPYFNGSERVALSPNGEEMSLELFLKCIELNRIDETELRERQNTFISNELKGGGEEFKDGPPCLEILTKEKITLTDYRDRFLYNYMVFAKKKYADNWKNKVIQAARNYFVFDADWTDDHVKKKIKAWDKPTAGHLCSQEPINTVCVKAECVKRKYGIASEKKPAWPALSNLLKIDHKPDPEYYFTVETKSGDTVSVHAKDVNKIRDQKEMRGLIMAQADQPPPPIKPMDFHEIIESLFSTIDVVQPAPGTSPLDILKKNLEGYINGAQATNYHSFKSGSPFKDKEFVYFIYDSFYNDYLKDRDWKKDISKTSYMIIKLFEKDKMDKDVKFDIRKRYPGKDSEGKPFPAIRGCVKIPLYLFDKEEEVDENIEIESKEDIV